MLCFLPPVFKAPDYAPYSSSPRAGGAAAFIIISIAAVGLLTPVGWSRSKPEYALRVGVASRLGPRSIERQLMSRLDGSRTNDTIDPLTSGQAKPPYSFFVSHQAYDALPPGLELDAVTGALVGVPTMAGSYTVVVGVTDGTNANSVIGPAFKVKVLPAS